MSKRALVATILAMSCGVQAEAQCHKRILLYVDMSGSMAQPAGPDSPFRQTVDAVRELLLIPDLIAATDELLVLPFSDTVGSADSARGAQRGTEGLARVGQPSANYTDLIAVFDDLTRRLEQPSGADRELVIIASDFLHSPPPASRNRNWREAVAARGANWASAVAAAGASGSARVALALLRAPVGRATGEAQAFVEALAGLRPRPFQVGVRGQSPAALARELSQLFYLSPDVTALLTGPQQFEVTVRNRGCMPLTLGDATIGCGATTAGDAVRVPFPAASRALDGVSSPGSVRSLTVDAARLSCPGAYEIRVSTAQAVVGTTTTTGESRLEFEVLRAILGPQFDRDLLELRVKAWGAVTDPAEFEATLGLGAEWRTTLVTGRLLPPRDLATARERAGIYRIVVPLEAEYRDRVVQDGVTLSVRGSPSQAQHTSVRVDSVTWASQMIGRPFAGLLGFGLAVWVGWLRHQRPLSAVRAFGDVVGLIVSYAPPAVMLAWGLLSGAIYGWSGDGAWLIASRDALGLGMAGCCGIIAAWWALRESSGATLRRALARGAAVAPTVGAYGRRVSFLWPTVIALVLAAATLVGVAVLHAGSPRRGDAAVAGIPFRAQ